MLTRSRTSSSLVAAVAGYGLVLLAAVGAPLATLPRWRDASEAGVAVLVAVGAAVVADRLDKRLAGVVFGVMTAALGLVLLTQARHGATSWVLAAITGAGVGFAVVGRRTGRNAMASFAVGVAVAVTEVVVITRWSGADAARLWALLGGPALLAAATDAPGREHRSSGATAPDARLVAPAALMVACVLTGAWVGANSPTERWFGDIVSHGPRSGNRVAITFDDGPDVPFTLEVRDILDAHGAKGTFFTVGKALDARPDVTAALLADGDVVANHSYRHDERGWLDPRYPELSKTQRAFRARLGVCPTFFRPPHGQHTPAMAWQVHRAGMQMVGWDVSAGDFATHDPALVARRVLAAVRPGSIIDLHDGLDGKVTADRSVLVRALPAILDGLAERGLQPVTLDELLGAAPYTGSCG